jgi:uncharacterized cupredoxin-like copper-binding protein
MHRRAQTGLAIATALCFATGCSSGAPRTGGQAAAVQVTERDFAIKAPAHATPGQVRFTLHNRGPDTHELIVVRTRSSRLPLRPDGLTVDEEKLEHATVGTIDDVEPDTVRHVRLRLAPGRYELICNMSGHYRGGMRHVLVVG